ncbi:MAG: hypothetical protein OHK93_004250 [Ramalina farinacea]|uniref:Uncharacterized protein n=1 Tax=Ramalina farinacea TaxID=258253 RepID=A0AA43TTC0_9LECA|nr:hypothetical protein [Ramalina farinacea]
MNTSLGTRIFIETTPMALEHHSLARLESRLEILQQELTTESLESAWSNDNKAEQELRQKHKLVSQDAREISKMRDANRRLHESLAGNDKAQSQSIHQRLANFMPFSDNGRTSIPVVQSTPPTLSSIAPFHANVQQSFLDRSDLENVLISQDIEILDSRRALVAAMGVLVDPISQKVTKQTSSHRSPLPNNELQSWFAQSGTDRPLETIGKTIERYGMVSSLRDQCWALCREKFGQLVDNAPDQSGIGMKRPENDVQYMRLTLQSPLRLEFRWQILIEDDGNVRSEVTPSLALPDAWANHDRNDDLSRLEEVFTSLLGQQGITQAIITLTRILISRGQQGASSDID